MRFYDRALARLSRSLGIAVVGMALGALAGACAPGPVPPPTAGPPAPEVTETELAGLVLSVDRPRVDINNRGQVVGLRFVDDRQRIGVWDGGQVTDVGPYTSRLCFPPPVTWCGSPEVAINDRGDVGTEIDGHAVLWQDGQLVDIDGDAEWSRFLGLNERGEALVVQVRAGQQILALWRRGELHEIVASPTSPGLPITVSGRLSDQGHVLVTEPAQGAGDPNGCPSTGVLWHRGERRQLGFFAGVDVNRHGQVIGIACEVVDGSANRFAALWDDGEITRVRGLPGSPPLVGSDGTGLLAINDRGQIVGYTVLPGDRPGSVRPHTFLWEDGEAVDIGTGTGGANQPVALNEHGQVLIQASLEVGQPAGFLWDEGTLVRLPPVDDPSTVIQVAGLNDAGQIVGKRDKLFVRTSAVLWQVRRP